MYSESQIEDVSKAIYKRLSKGEQQPVGFVKGGEYLVYNNGGKLSYCKSDSQEGQLAEQGENVICLIAYYDTPNFNSECTVEHIKSKITDSLKDQ